MRLFWAVEAGPPAAERLREACEDLRGAGADVKWVSSFHLTMAFLGDIPPDRENAAAEAGKRAVSGMSAAGARVAGLGAFPSWKRPKVLWAGLDEEGRNALTETARVLHKELMEEGFQLEKRAFLPHITLGRVRSGRGLEALDKRLERWRPEKAWDGASFDAKELVLFESRLTQAGPAYTPRSRAAMAAPV